MTLHEAIELVLRTASRPMKAADIAHQINIQKLYTRGDGASLSGTQVSARVNKRPGLFFKRNGYIYLIGGEQQKSSIPVKEDTSIEGRDLPDPLAFTNSIESITHVRFLTDNEFHSLGMIRDLLRIGLPRISELEYCGVYAISVPQDYNVAFIAPSEAQDFGNVISPWTVERLREKWVADVDIVYFGIAGAQSQRSLRQRVRDLLRHGSGKTTDRGPHKGGEILWQLADYGRFGVWIRPTEGPPVPRQIETQFLKQFYASTGKLPFANRQF